MKGVLRCIRGALAGMLVGLGAISCIRAEERPDGDRGTAGSQAVTVTTAVAEVVDPGVRTDSDGISTWVDQIVRTSVGGDVAGEWIQFIDEEVRDLSVGESCGHGRIETADLRLVATGDRLANGSGTISYCVTGLPSAPVLDSAVVSLTDGCVTIELRATGAPVQYDVGGTVAGTWATCPEGQR